MRDKMICVARHCGASVQQLVTASGLERETVTAILSHDSKDNT